MSKKGSQMAEHPEEQLFELNLAEVKDLTELTQFFKKGTKFLQEYRLAQAKGDLAEKNRLAKHILRFKQFLLSSMDRIESRLKMSESAIDAYMEKEAEWNEDEKAFLELTHQELKKALYKPSTWGGAPVAKMKQGKTKMKNWMRP